MRRTLYLAFLLVAIPVSAQQQWGTWSPGRGAFGDWRWASPLANAAAIEALTGTPGECIAAMDTGLIYCWSADLPGWVVQGGGGGGEWWLAPYSHPSDPGACDNAEAVRVWVKGAGRYLTRCNGAEFEQWFPPHSDEHAFGGSDELDAASLASGCATGAAPVADGTGGQQCSASPVVVSTDSRLSDARTPTAHAASHQHGGADEVGTVTPGANGIPKADGTGKLAAGWVPTLNQDTTGNAATATLATTASAGDSATAFFSSGTVEAARLPDLSGLNGAVTDAQVPNTITVDQATTATTATTANGVAANSVALGPDTTGGYAGSSTEGGAADNGDSATGFFPIGSVEVAHGGTGSTSLAAHGVVIGNGTSAVAVTAAGTTGQVLTSNGASADPTFQAVSAAAPFLGGGADDADTGLLRGSNGVDLVCSEKAATGTDACIAYTSSDTWTVSIAGTVRLTVAAGSLNFTSNANTNQELTLGGQPFGPGSQGSSNGWTFYKSGSSEDAITSSGYSVQSGNVVGFNNGNASSNDVKDQGQLKGGQSKTLTDNTATAFVRLTMSSGSTIGGTITYQVGATDGTDYQSRSGIVPFSAVDKGGTITCTIATVDGATEVVAASAGTLTNNAFTCADAGSNLLELRANMDSSLSSPTVTMKWQAEVIGVQGTLVITPQ